MEQYKNFFERIFCKGEINEFVDVVNDNSHTVSTIKSDTSSLNTSIFSDLSHMKVTDGSMDLFFENEDGDEQEFGAIFLNNDDSNKSITSAPKSNFLTDDIHANEFDGLEGFVQLNNDFHNTNTIEDLQNGSKDLNDNAKELMEMLKSDISEINETVISVDDSNDEINKNDNEDLDIPML